MGGICTKNAAEIANGAQGVDFLGNDEFGLLRRRCRLGFMLWP